MCFKIVKKDKLEYITFNVLNKYNIKHGFFLKNGGVSKGVYDSLNFRLYGKDNIEDVFKNFEIVKKELMFNEVYKAKQNHTDNILILDNNNKDKYTINKINQEEYDAYITNLSLPTIVTTADCNAIIIYDPINKVVANIHSGWKGTILQIYLKVCNILKKKFNSNYSDLIVCIGPSIRKCCFTSKEESFKNKFTKVWDYENKYIDLIEDTYHIDLLYVIKKDLTNLGIKAENIYDCNICTLCNDNCFSYRRCLRNKDLDYGTMGCFVSL